MSSDKGELGGEGWGSSSDIWRRLKPMEPLPAPSADQDGMALLRRRPDGTWYSVASDALVRSIFESKRGTPVEFTVDFDAEAQDG